MNTVEQNLIIMRKSLMLSIPIGGLLSRNAIAYKWKAPYRCWLLREAAFWRVTDLLTQSYALHQEGHGLGARILLRSAFETLATLIYLNHKMQSVTDGKLGFADFNRETTALVAGSRDDSTDYTAVNVLTMLNKGDKRYPGLRALYDHLSESAHPNFEGMITGYSKIKHNEYETHFSNRWFQIYGGSHLGSMEFCMMTFRREYDEEWPERIEKLESWIVANDTQLEATKNKHLPAG